MSERWWTARSAASRPPATDARQGSSALWRAAAASARTRKEPKASKRAPGVQLAEDPSGKWGGGAVPQMAQPAVTQHHNGSKAIRLARLVASRNSGFPPNARVQLGCAAPAGALSSRARPLRASNPRWPLGTAARSHWPDLDLLHLKRRGKAAVSGSRWLRRGIERLSNGFLWLQWTQTDFHCQPCAWFVGSVGGNLAADFEPWHRV